MTDYSLTSLIEQAGFILEAFGVLVIIVGALIAACSYCYKQLTAKSGDPYDKFRRDMGRAMMVGLEFLVAGDIIRTVIISHTMADIGALGLLVLIRTLLVFTIHLELEGRWPWQAPRRDV